jgi:hypothetical protein
VLLGRYMYYSELLKDFHVPRATNAGESKKLQSS